MIHLPWREEKMYELSFAESTFGQLPLVLHRFRSLFLVSLAISLVVHEKTKPCANLGLEHLFNALVGIAQAGSSRDVGDHDILGLPDLHQFDEIPDVQVFADSRSFTMFR